MTTDFFTPLSSTALMILEMERNTLGVAVIANTLFSLKEMTLAFLCRSGLIFARMTAALEFFRGNMTVFMVSPSTEELTSSPSPAAVDPLTTLKKSPWSIIV